jgi:hypothetical protein
MIIATILLAIWCLVLSLKLRELTKEVDRLLYLEPQQGNLSRKWKGYWKIRPDEKLKIVNDPRTCEVIAKEYGVSTSYISQIKRKNK